MEERLTIDEIIEHCNRKTQNYERSLGKDALYQIPVHDSTFVKEYWEHKQVAEYLMELKRCREY